MKDGEQIGRYKIISELGRGAMGIVYKAQDTTIGRVVAIKSIRLSDLTDDAERQRLRDRLFREAQSAGVLSHPNIVTIYDFSEEKGLAYIFMEYVNGPTLDKLLASREPPPKETLLSLLRQTAGALDYAHRKGIVHRDIKPANVMVHDGGLAKVTDFGVARIVSHQMTQTGTMMGTPNYMSPEQVQGGNVDGRADQFSLAVVAWEMLTGERPFASEYLPTLLYKIVREDAPPVERMNPTLGPQIDAVLHQALAKDPARRYEECTQFVDALIKACGATPGWTPMTHGAAENMPTVMGAAPQQQPAEAAAAVAVREKRNPLLRGLVWALVGIGIVGLAIISAQRFLMSTPVATTAAETTAPPARLAEVPVRKPSPGRPEARGSQSPAVLQPQSNGTTPASPTAQDIAPPPASPRPTPDQRVRPQSGGSSALQIVTEPSGARITIDGNPQLACTSPCMETLPPGRHTLKAEAAGYRPALRIFNTPATADVFVGLESPTGTLSIVSTPASAAITVNGAEQTRRTPAVLILPPGSYRIGVARGGRRRETDVTINEGEFHTLNLSLE